jgi:Domain of unknown function (DUF4350)
LSGVQVRLALVVGALALASPIPAAAAAAPSTHGSKDVAPLVDEVFKQRRHRFCHDPSYPLTQEELDWCALLPAKDTRCPSLRRACAAGVRAQLVGQQQKLDLKLPQLPPFASVILWVLLGCLAVLVIGMLIRQAMGWSRPPDADSGAREAGPVRPDADAALAAAVETDVMRLLERARAAAAAGDYRQAIEAAYAALLRKLEGSNLIRVEAHRTNGDYLRDLGQRQPALRPRVKQVVSEVERIEFGGDVPGEGQFRWVHDRVLGLVTERMLVVLVALGLLGAAGGCRPQRDLWDDSPSGRSALREVLRENGIRVNERISDLAHVPDDVHTLVLMPDAEMDEADWPALLTWIQKGRTLVVAGRPRRASPWLGMEFADQPLRASQVVSAEPAAKQWYGAVQVTVPPSTRMLREQGGREEEEEEKEEGAEARKTETEQAEEAEEEAAERGWRRLMSRGGGLYAADSWWGESGKPQGRVVAFADDRLFCNAALLAPGNARFVTALLAERGDRVQFAGSVEGIVAQNPVTSVTRGRLAPAMLQLGLAALVFFLYRGAHFGRPRAETVASRRAFVDHVRALGLVYARARAGRVALEHYGAWATERLAERLRLGGSRKLSLIAEGVAARTGRPVGEVMRLLVEARPDAEPPPAGRDAEAMANLRALAALVSQTAADARTEQQKFPRNRR